MPGNEPVAAVDRTPSDREQVEHPVLSVIVPVYNMEEYLRECLDSVLLHGDLPLEVICVNDGSTDLSSQILEEYRQRFTQLTVIHQRNKGLSGARNRGLRRQLGSTCASWTVMMSCARLI
nr:glycosyltransferase family 2 protein [Tessaracoccus coleopterorum]